MVSPERVFVISPADLSGARARRLLRGGGTSEVPRRLRSAEGATIGAIFGYVSGLYFRGKLEYADTFARPAADEPGIHVIVPGLGLRPPNEAITARALERVASVPVAVGDARYAKPLRADLARLARTLAPDAEVVLLGSVSTAKYLPFLEGALRDRVRVPRALVGLGMMQRGALLRRRAAEGRELEYVRP